MSNFKDWYGRHKKEILLGCYILQSPELMDLVIKEQNRQREAMECAYDTARKDFENYKKKVEFEVALDYASK